MNWLVVVAVGAALGACGDNPATRGPDAADPADITAQLATIPGLTVSQQPTSQAGYTYYVLHFTQPVDHDQPDGPTFQQEASLIVRDTTSPLIVHTSGYWDYYLDTPVELTRLLTANQISIEHRFFAGSRPTPADWSKLTIAQMAADEHAIIAALHPIFSGAFVTTGASKGGMTAVYHRRFYPDDVAGTVPYVAPLSFGAPDHRYDTFFDTVGTPACRDAVRALATEMLKNRRAALLARATTQATTEGHHYTRIPIGPALEGAIAALEWSFWQYHGITECAQLPATTADDDTLFAFLDNVAPVTDSDDASCAQFDAYYYQADAQLGYPATSVPYLSGYLQYADADYVGSLPSSTAPAYDNGVAMHDIDDYVQASGDRLLFVYGQWDPWSGGEFVLGNARDSARYIQAEGTHGSHLSRLADADRADAFAKLAAWTGVTPEIPISKFAPEPRAPRTPPGMLRVRRIR